MKNLFFGLIICFAFACSKDDSKGDDQNDDQNGKWISEIIEYKPAPGQFINTSSGSPEVAKGMVGRLGNDVSLGGYGGSITFKFNHKVKNIDGVDFVIFGNAFKGSSEPGIVMVLSGGEWYELKGAEYNKSLRNYTITYFKPESDDDDITWTDNQSSTGAIEKVSMHTQPYFPKFIDAKSLIFSGSKLLLNIYTDDNNFIVLDAFGNGYVDNFSEDYDEIVGGDKDTKGSNKFDISNAVNSGGESVKLTEIEAVKVYNCVNQQAGALGECSTEIRGAISLSSKK